MNVSKKNNPFKTPEGYFENFTDGLMDKLNEQKFNLPKEDGFLVHEDYFDGVHKSILEKLDATETKVVQLRSYQKLYIAAASVAATLLVVFGLNRNTTEALTFDALAEAEIETYFEGNEYGLSSYEIAEMLPVAELEINDIVAHEFNEENVVEYLNNTIDDFEALNIEYDE